jgi:hypothetical protein
MKPSEGANYKSELHFVRYIMDLEAKFSEQLFENAELTNLQSIEQGKVKLIQVWKAGLSKDANRIFSNLVANVYRTELIVEPINDSDDEMQRTNATNRTVPIDPSSHSEMAVGSDRISTETTIGENNTDKDNPESNPSKTRRHDWEESDEDESSEVEFSLETIKNSAERDFIQILEREDLMHSITEILHSSDLSGQLFIFAFVNILH